MGSQSLIGYFILVVFGLIIWGVSGYLVGSIIIPWGNHFISSFSPSQDSMNTATLLLQIMIASPLLGILLWGYDHIVNSASQSGGDY